MQKRKAVILYIDDAPELQLLEFLRQLSEKCENFDYSDIIFTGENSYDNLMKNETMKKADIIIIDYKLFENKNSKNGKIDGRQIKLIIKKVFPFKEVIIITQKSNDSENHFIHKFDCREEKDHFKYYNEKLFPEIKKAYENNIEMHKTIDSMKKEKIFSKVMLEKIDNSLNGDDTYDELKKEDIDEIIKIFKEIKSKNYDS